MDMVRAEGVISEYTADQWGLVTTAQAAQVGVDGVTLIRMREAGLITTVRRGVHAANSAPEPFHRAEQALWLSFAPSRPAWERDPLEEDGGVISHTSAARMHGLGEFVADVITVTVPRRRLVRDPEVRVRVRKLSADDVTLVDGLPVTTVARTVRDLLDDRHDASHVADLIRGGYGAGLLDLGELADSLGPYSRRYGVPGKDGARLLDHLLAQVGTSVDLLAQPPAAGSSTGPLTDLVARSLLGVGIDSKSFLAGLSLATKDTNNRFTDAAFAEIQKAVAATLAGADVPDVLSSRKLDVVGDGGNDTRGHKA